MEKKKCSKQQPQDLYTSEKVLLHQYTAETPQQKKLNRTQCRMKTVKERNIRLKELNAAVFLFFEKNRANLVTTWL